MSNHDKFFELAQPEPQRSYLIPGLVVVLAIGTGAVFLWSAPKPEVIILPVAVTTPELRSDVAAPTVISPAPTPEVKPLTLADLPEELIQEVGRAIPRQATDSQRKSYALLIAERARAKISPDLELLHNLFEQPKWPGPPRPIAWIVKGELTEAEVDRRFSEYSSKFSRLNLSPPGETAFYAEEFLVILKKYTDWNILMEYAQARFYEHTTKPLPEWVAARPKKR